VEASASEHLSTAPERKPARVHRVLGVPRARAVAFDALVLGLAMVATTVSTQLSDIADPPLAWSIIFVLVALAALAANEAYAARFNVQFLDDLRAVLGATAIAAMSVTFARVVFTERPDIASQGVRAWLFAATYLAAARAGFRLVQANARRRGVGTAPTLIVGAGRVGQHVATRLANRPEFGLRPAAFFDEDPLPIENRVDLPIRGAVNKDVDGDAGDRLEAALQEFEIEEVVVTFSLASHELQLELVRRCLAVGVGVSLVPRLFEGVPDQTNLERIGGIPLISVHPSDPRGWQFELKYALDRLLAALAVAATSPLLLFAAVGTLLTLGRPVLFRQPRVGIDGKHFNMLKFRTMHAGPATLSRGLAEALERGMAPGGVEGEDRRTRFGTLLRRTSLDELPQLFNVLRGDMSLVGPRPERPEFVSRFGGEVHRYADRLRVKSGITGWAQVHGLRGQTSIADRVEWDNYYIENWSFWLDLKICFRTLVIMLRTPE
jgi:exopolysaccharide biosynthesis polyprenyl glycosylphosphotransferase